MSLINLHPETSGDGGPPFFFKRRTERLDWRKIASLDLEKIIQDGQLSLLSDLIHPTLFCKAEAEFDSNLDPGFLKVFRLSQLIGEFLIFQRDREREKSQKAEERCLHATQERELAVSELTAAKESLHQLRKELKKTKDMLASTQTQLLGSKNLDEIDQCPYCSKYFLAPFLLLAHLQRRHQGLPVPLSLKAQASSLTNFGGIGPIQQEQAVYAFTTSTGNGRNSNPMMEPFQPNPRQSSSSTPFSLPMQKDSETQTAFPLPDPNGNSAYNSSTSSLNLNVIKSPAPAMMKGFDHNRDRDDITDPDLPVICDMVQKYLEGKSANASTIPIPDRILQSMSIQSKPEAEKVDGRSSSSSLLEERVREVERIEQNVIQMRDEFESKWRKLSEKVQDSPVEELRSSFLSEIKKVQDLILQTPARVVEPEETKPKPSGDASAKLPTLAANPRPEAEADNDNKSKEELMQMEVRFQKLSEGLKAEMDSELLEMRNKLEAQELSWLQRMKGIEALHQKEVEKLQEALNEKVRKEEEEKAVIMRMRMTEEENDEFPITEEEMNLPEGEAQPQPQPKPRRALLPLQDHTHAHSTHLTTTTMPVRMFPEIQLVESRSRRSSEGFGEEDAEGDYLTIIGDEDWKPQSRSPKGDGDSNSTISSCGESESEGDSESESEASPNEVVERPKPTTILSKGQAFEGQGQRPSQMDLVRDRMVLTELDKRMESVGVSKDATELSLQEMSRAMKLVSENGRKLSQNEGKFSGEVERLRESVKYEAVKASLREELERRTPSKSGESGKLASILHKVAKSGSSWKNKVAAAIKLRKRNAEPDTKTTFFSKWGQKGKGKKDGQGQTTATNANTNTNIPDSSEDTEESSSDLDMPPYMTRSQPILHTQEEKRKRSKSKSNSHKRNLRRRRRRNQKSSDSGDSPSEKEEEAVGRKSSERKLKLPASSNSNSGNLRSQLMTELKEEKPSSEIISKFLVSSVKAKNLGGKAPATSYDYDYDYHQKRQGVEVHQEKEPPASQPKQPTFTRLSESQSESESVEPEHGRQRETETGTAAVLNEKPKPLDLENENEEKENQQNPVASDTSFWDTEDEEEIYSEKENPNFTKPSDHDLSFSRFLQEKKVKVNEEEDDDSSIFDISGFDDSLDLNKKPEKPKVNLQKTERPKTAVRRKENPNPNNSWDSD